MGDGDEKRDETVASIDWATLPDLARPYRVVHFAEVMIRAPFYARACLHHVTIKPMHITSRCQSKTCHMPHVTVSQIVRAI
jgi:hypothetical protein